MQVLTTAPTPCLSPQVPRGWPVEREAIYRAGRRLPCASMIVTRIASP